MKTTYSDRQNSKYLIYILVITWILFFLFGVVGHLQLKNSFTESCFKSLQLFHLHYHPFPGSAETEEPALSISGWLEIARFGAGLWALSLFPALIGLFFEDRIKLWWIRIFWHNHYIVCGECSRSLALVRDLRLEKLNVIMIGTCLPEGMNIPAGVVYLRGDSADDTLLNKALIIRAKHIISLHENDRANIETLIAASNISEKRPKKYQPLIAHAHISNKHLPFGLHQLYDRRERPLSTRFSENRFNYNELFAQLFIRKFIFPPFFVNPNSEPVHLVILGFSSFGQSIALKFVKMAQQFCWKERNDEKDGKNGKNGKWIIIKPQLTIIDIVEDSTMNLFLQSYPAFNEFCTLTIHRISKKETDFRDLGILKKIEKNRNKSIVLCLEDEYVNLTVLDTLQYSSIRDGSSFDNIFIRIAQPERLGVLLENNKLKDKMTPIICFASDKEIFNSKVILNESLDKIAIAFYSAYENLENEMRKSNNFPKKHFKTWEELSEDDRQSNRETADHSWVKLGMLGYRIEEVPANVQTGKDQGVIFELEQRIEELAEFEHYRWMVWRILNGWQYGPIRDNELKLHPDIVDYEKINKSRKDIDRNNILALIELFRNGSLKIVR